MAGAGLCLSRDSEGTLAAALLAPDKSKTFTSIWQKIVQWQPKVKVMIPHSLFSYLSASGIIAGHHLQPHLDQHPIKGVEVFVGSSFNCCLLWKRSDFQLHFKLPHHLAGKAQRSLAPHRPAPGGLTKRQEKLSCRSLLKPRFRYFS